MRVRATGWQWRLQGASRKPQCRPRAKSHAWERVRESREPGVGPEVAGKQTPLLAQLVTASLPLGSAGIIAQCHCHWAQQPSSIVLHHGIGCSGVRSRGPESWDGVSWKRSQAGGLCFSRGSRHSVIALWAQPASLLSVIALLGSAGIVVSAVSWHWVQWNQQTQCI